MTKVDVLAYLDEVDAATAFDLADAMDLAYPAAAMALLRAARQGLARRAVEPWTGLYRYALTPRGLDRLAYLREFEDDEAEGDA